MRLLMATEILFRPGRFIIPRVTSTAVICLATCLSCAREPDVPALDIAGVRGQLDSVWSGLGRAMTAGDTTKLADFYSDSALFAETGSPTLRGLSSIRSATAAVFACCRYLESNVQPELTEVSGGRAFQFGTYRDVIQPSGQPVLTFYGRYSAIFDRDSAETWRLTRIAIIRDSSVPPMPRSR
jgi:ketosteroid isomerase-like protein